MARQWNRVTRFWRRLFGKKAPDDGVPPARASSEQRRRNIEEQIAALDEEIGDLKRGMILGPDPKAAAVSLDVRRCLIRSRDLRYKIGLLRAELQRSFPESEYATGGIREASPGESGAAGGLEDCLQCLADRDPDVRRSAATSLGKQGSRAVAPALTVILRDEDVDVRVAAARALESLCLEQAVYSLIRALEDEEAAVRTAAKSALARTLSVPLDIDVHQEPDLLLPKVETLLRWWSEARAEGLPWNVPVFLRSKKLHLVGEQKRGRSSNDTIYWSEEGSGCYGETRGNSC